MLRIFSFSLLTGVLILIFALRFTDVLSFFGMQLAIGLYIGLFALLLYITFFRQKKAKINTSTV